MCLPTWASPWSHDGSYSVWSGGRVAGAPRSDGIRRNHSKFPQLGAHRSVNNSKSHLINMERLQTSKKSNVTGCWRPISRMLSMSSFTFTGSLVLVRIRGRRILSSGISLIITPDFGFKKGTPDRSVDGWCIMHVIRFLWTENKLRLIHLDSLSRSRKKDQQ